MGLEGQPPLDGVVVHDQELLIQKLDEFRDAGEEQLRYLFDFDRTVTSSASLGEDMTVWNLLDDLLPEEVRASYDQLSRQYQDMEFAGLLSPQDALAWWALSFDLYVKHDLSLQKVKDAVGQMSVREGAVELFSVCEKHDIPTVILSAGIGDVIELIAEEHDIHPTSVLSTRLRLDTNGRITGWDPDSLVHVFNKQDKGRTTLAGIARPYTVLVGDSLEDANMVAGDAQVLRVRVSDKYKVEKMGRERYIQEGFDAGFDMVIGEDLFPLVSLTKWFLSQE